MPQGELGYASGFRVYNQSMKLDMSISTICLNLFTEIKSWFHSLEVIYTRVFAVKQTDWSSTWIEGRV